MYSMLLLAHCNLTAFTFLTLMISLLWTSYFWIIIHIFFGTLLFHLSLEILFGILH